MQVVHPWQCELQVIGILIPCSLLEHCSYVEQWAANYPIEACQLCAWSEAAQHLVSPDLLQWAKVSAERGFAAAAALALEKAAQDLARVSGSPSFLEYPD